MKRKEYVVLLAMLMWTGYRTFAQSPGYLARMADTCMELVKVGDPDSASVICSRLVVVADKLPDGPEKGKLFRIAGNVALQKNEYGKAEKFYQKALNISKKIGRKDGDRLKATTIFNRSLLYYINGDYQTTLTMCLEAQNIFLRLNDLRSLAEVDNRIGGVYQVLDQLDKASYYNQKAYREARQSGDKETICSVLIAYGNWMLNKGDTLGAIERYRESIQIGHEINRPHFISTANYDIGYAYSCMNNFPLALQYYRNAYQWGKIGKLGFDECDALYKVGLVLYYSRDFVAARDTLLTALKMAQEMNSMILQRNIYDALNFLEAEAGNFQKAFEYLSHYTDLSENVLSEQGQHQVNFLEAKYQNAQKTAEIEKLHHRTQLILIFLVILVLVFVGGYIYIHQRHQVLKMNAQIQGQRIKDLEQEKKLIAAKALLEGETTERTRLAKDLHDGLGGMLSATKLKIAHMKGNLTIPEEHVPAFNMALDMLDGSIRELRRVAHNLMPESLMKYGLNPALTDFCNGIEKVHYYFFGSDRRLDDKLEVAIYRIVQELVNNALRHSEAEQINVQLILESNRASVVVQDDGKGFDTALVEEGNNGGLQNIRFRVASFGGRIDFISAPGKGTEVTVEFDC